ncbi:hypothetical protein Rhein_1470 [Rheinheimera sp. A13L]|nr:hypothetical protein Rhein_1470 [Rheinheimera sp. A13L]
MAPEIQQAFGLLLDYKLLATMPVTQELENAMSMAVKKVSQAKRKDPLIDFASLATVGRQASKAARERALENGVSFTFAQHGMIKRRHPDGRTEIIRPMANTNDFPTLEQDLCRD